MYIFVHYIYTYIYIYIYTLIKKLYHLLPRIYNSCQLVTDKLVDCSKT